MIRYKADGLYRNVSDLFGRMKLSNSIADIRLEPGLLGWTRTTLENQLPAWMPRHFRDQFAGFEQLSLVSRMIGHAHRYTVRTEE